MEDKKHNRLINEQSPYLLKHASNPVDWHPWGEEAFALAAELDRPIFLSVGYTTCHWCNVMEDESFSDTEVADLMNSSFVSIKVDREERPDIDGVYMTVCQMLTGAGGWPLTILMTPQKKPFFAGTYIPKEARFGRIGMMELVPQIKELWKNKREELLSSVDEILTALKANVEVSASTQAHKTGHELSALLYNELAKGFDAQWGGFSPAPKFPTAHIIMFLLSHSRQSNDEHALHMAELTLSKMRLGGVFDQLGLGFHRYSTDEQWKVPHFEKMLYDQAMLAISYIWAFEGTGKSFYSETVREIFSFVLKELQHPDGGFYSAISADSEGEEGTFYLWTLSEVQDVLGQKDAEIISKLLNIENLGNFVDPMVGDKTGKNVLYMNNPMNDAIGEADRFKVNNLMTKLYEARQMRQKPELDDKVLVDWNGLMIVALAQGGRALGEDAYIDAAKRAGDFLLREMRHSEGRLLHRWRNGHRAVEGNADDYAMLSWGMLELYAATYEPRWLEAAIQLMGQLMDGFCHEDTGVLYYTRAGQDDLPVRKMEVSDSAMPSANSIALWNLLTLSGLTGKVEYESSASKLMASLGGQVAEAPWGFAHYVTAASLAEEGATQIVVVGKPEADDTRTMLRSLERGLHPGLALLLKPDGDELIDKLAPYVKSYNMLEGLATAYVCRDKKCLPPTSDIETALGYVKGSE